MTTGELREGAKVRLARGWLTHIVKSRDPFGRLDMHCGKWEPESKIRATDLPEFGRICEICERRAR